MASILPNGKQYYETTAGIPLVGGKVYTYDAGTTNPRATYSDAAGTIPNTNPVILDARGEALIFWNGSYKVTLQDSLGNVIWTVDGVQSVDVSINAALAVLTGPTGASNVGFTITSIGAAVRTLLTKGRDTISILDFAGIDNTGVTECSAAFQAALTATRIQGAPVNQGKILHVNSGTYKISATLICGSTQGVFFEPGVTIDGSGLPNENASLFSAAGQTGIYFEGNGALLKGARATANPSIEGGSAAFFMYGTDDIDIRNFRIQDFATDGITITGDNTGSGPCTNVVIYNCVSKNNRRNALSIISAIGCIIFGGEYTTSNGSPSGPYVGIDIEPNQDCFMQGIVLIGVRTSGNLGGGISIVPGQLSTVGAASNVLDVQIIGGRSFNDGTVNTTNKPGLLFGNGGNSVNIVYGQVKVDGFVVDSPWDRGVTFVNWDADKCPRAILTDCIVRNPDIGQNGSGNDNRSAYVIYADASQAVTNLGNITMRNCRAEDTRATTWMPTGFFLATVAGKVLKNILIVDPSVPNMAASVKCNVYTNAALIAGGMNNVDVVYTTRTPCFIAASQDISRFMGQRLTVTNPSNLTLPPAANCLNGHYEIEAEVTINSIAIVPVTGDTIGWLVDMASTSLVIDNNAVLSVRARGSNTWVPEEVDGKNRIAGNAIQGQTLWVSSIPTTGTHTQGDVAVNKVASVGSPKGWRCTVAGTPGTWVSEGNL